MKLKKLKDDNEAVLGYFLVFIVVGSMLVFLFSFAIPFLIDFSTDMYIAGEDIINDTEDKLDDITNATIKSQIQNSLNNMQSATADNIDNLAFFFQYGWVFVVLIVMFTIFILARKAVETKGYYGGVV